VTGDRSFVMGDATGRYPASGWHIRGEMAGFWTPPVKLLDGVCFAVDGAWLGDDIAAERYTSGGGYQRFGYRTSGGVHADRVDFAPDGSRAAVVGLVLRSDTAQTVNLAMDAHSELMPAYPWGWTTPSAGQVNLPDTAGYADGTLVFRDQGSSPVTGARDYAAVVGSSLRPTGHAVGQGYRGPQEPPVVCPADGPAPFRCDDSATGHGASGRLDYQVRLDPGRPRTVWFTVAGSDQGLGAARSEYVRASQDPARALRDKVDSRLATARRTVVDLPGDRLLQRSVEWSKQNLADSVQEAHDLVLRDVDEGRAYPPASGTLRSARWLGAGFPDYPWLFATDGEYTAFAAVAAGQFEPIKAHLQALRDVSEVVNGRSGKVVHEVVSTGDVYFGANDDPGNTDETVKFPSAVMYTVSMGRPICDSADDPLGTRAGTPGGPAGQLAGVASSEHRRASRVAHQACRCSVTVGASLAKAVRQVSMRSFCRRPTITTGCTPWELALATTHPWLTRSGGRGSRLGRIHWAASSLAAFS
jgi:hypothetical protein